MGVVKISELTAASSAAATDQVPVNQGGTTVRDTVQQIAAVIAKVAADHVFQAFRLHIVNTAGTLQHRICSTAGLTEDSLYADKVSGATATLNNTPTGADASTAFVAGGKVSSASTNTFVFDVVTQDSATQEMWWIAVITYNDTDTALTCHCANRSRDVNGTTRYRLEIDLYDAATGAAFAINTTNFASGESIRLTFIGTLK